MNRSILFMIAMVGVLLAVAFVVVRTTIRNQERRGAYVPEGKIRWNAPADGEESRP